MKLSIAFVLALCAGTAAAQTTTETKSFWDDQGHFAGSSSSHENTTSYSDRDGRFNGSSIRNSDGTTSLYDRNGHFSGSVTNTTHPQWSGAKGR